MRPKYREIIRLAQPHLKFSQEMIVTSLNYRKGYLYYASNSYYLRDVLKWKGTGY